MKRWLFLALWVPPLLAQSNTGELRLNVTTRLWGAEGSVEISSDASHHLQTLLTDDTGILAVNGSRLECIFWEPDMIGAQFRLS